MDTHSTEFLPKYEKKDTPPKKQKKPPKEQISYTYGS